MGFRQRINYSKSTKNLIFLPGLRLYFKELWISADWLIYANISMINPLLSSSGIIVEK